jgi:hypothetical protein
MSTRPQTYAAHRRYHAWFHFIGVPREVLSGELRERNDIKRRISKWRADWLRV